MMRPSVKQSIQAQRRNTSANVTTAVGSFKQSRPQTKLNQPKNSSSNLTSVAKKDFRRGSQLESQKQSLSKNASSANPESKQEDSVNQSTSEQAQPPQQASGNIRVFCRFRPLNAKEMGHQGGKQNVQFIDQSTCQMLSEAGSDGLGGKYTFDKCFNTESTQQEVYESAVKPIVLGVMEGFNGTVFAYGQTSSGKTHTMLGLLNDPQLQGVIPRMVRTVFDTIENASGDIEFTVTVSMVEIYMEKIKDLLEPTKKNLQVHEDRKKGIYIADMTERSVVNELEVMEIMQTGNENRAIGVTDMNSQSSRSHSCFILQVHQQNNEDLSSKTGKLYLVDLAGSEKVGKTGAQGHTLEEAKMINKSLQTLGMVINNLTDGHSTHVPYRDSKLTRILQESLGGNAKTGLIIACSPSVYNDEETKGTLKFGQRAKKVKNKPKVNKDLSVAELKKKLDQANQRIDQLEKQNAQLLQGLVPKELKKVVEPIPAPVQQEVIEPELVMPSIEVTTAENTTISIQQEESNASKIEISQTEESVETQKKEDDTQQDEEENKTLDGNVQNEQEASASAAEDEVEDSEEVESLSESQIDRDEDGSIRIFNQLHFDDDDAQPQEDEEQQDELSEFFLGLNGNSLKIKVLLQALKDALCSVNESNTKIDFLKSKFKDNFAALKQLKDDHLQKEGQIRELSNQCEMSQIKLEEARFVDNKQLKKIDELQSQVDTLRMHSEQQTVRMLEDQEQIVKQTKEKFEQSKSQANEREQKLLKETIQQNKKDKDVYMQFVNQQKDHISTLQKENDQLSAEIQKLKLGLGMSDKQKLELSEKTMQYQKDIEQLRILYQQLATEKNATSTKNNHLCTEIARKKNKIKQLKEEAQVLTKQYIELKDAKKKSEKKLIILSEQTKEMINLLRKAKQDPEIVERLSGQLLKPEENSNVSYLRRRTQSCAFQEDEIEDQGSQLNDFTQFMDSSFFTPDVANSHIKRTITGGRARKIHQSSKSIAVINTHKPIVEEEKENQQ